MTVLSFVRHGTTAWNAQGRMQGRCDVPLSAVGRAEVARWRLPLDHGACVDWLSSPLSRSLETARILGAGALRVEPALIEMDWGKWEGFRLEELRAHFGAAFAANERRGLDFRPPGGESPREVMVRVLRWLGSVGPSDRPLVAVTHNGVLRALLALASGWDMTGKPPVKLRPATLQRFALERGPRLALLECNVPLAGAQDASAPRPSPPPAPSAAPR